MDHNYSIKQNVPQTTSESSVCCIPQCRKYPPAVRTSFHSFPKNAEMKKKWEKALRMTQPATETMEVCSRHFIASNYFQNGTVKHKLLPDAIPCQRLPKGNCHKRRPSNKKRWQQLRDRKAEVREMRKLAAARSTGGQISGDAQLQSSKKSHDMTTPDQNGDGSAYNLRHDKFFHQDKCAQVNMLHGWNGATLTDLLVDDQSLFAFTGIRSINMLEKIVSFIEKLCLYETTNYNVLPVKDRVLLTMIRVKQNMPFAAIGVLFGLNRQTCFEYFQSMYPMLTKAGSSFFTRRK